MLRMVLVRHGQSVANLQNLCGRTQQSPLSKLGRSQASQLGSVYAGELRKAAQTGGIFASAAVRAKETAQVALEAAGFCTSSEMVTVSEGLNEIFTGDWDGLVFDVVKEQWYALLDADPLNAKAPGDGSESRADVMARVRDFLGSVTTTLEEKSIDGDGCTLFVFAHLVSIQCILNVALDLNPRHQVLLDNTSCTVLERPSGQEWRLRDVNNTRHLYAEEFQAFGFSGLEPSAKRART